MTLDTIELSMEELQNFLDTCHYKFSKGNQIGGCGHNDAPKGSDKKGGCDRNQDREECPILEFLDHSTYEKHFVNREIDEK